jgi:hypothetical protein
MHFSTASTSFFIDALKTKRENSTGHLESYQQGAELEVRYPAYFATCENSTCNDDNGGKDKIEYSNGAILA